MKCLWLLSCVFFLSGCGTARQFISFYQPKAYRVPNYASMSYVDILRSEFKQHKKRPRKRMIMLYGKANENQREAGIKVVIPF